MEITIDGMEIEKDSDFYIALYKKLNMPSWAGKNLDALWDVIDGMVEKPLKIVWINSNISRERMKDFEKIILVLRNLEIKSQNSGGSIFEITLE